MVPNTKPIQLFYFYFHFWNFLKMRIVRKLTGLVNQNKKLVLLGTIGVLRIVYGKTDADAFFGCFMPSEDDFKRVEMNYIEKTGASLKSKENRFYIMI
jgi:hypothetical protein